MLNKTYVSRPVASVFACIAVVSLVLAPATASARPAYCQSVEQQLELTFQLSGQAMRQAWERKRALASSVSGAMKRFLRGLSPFDRIEIVELLAGRGNRSDVARRLRAAAEPLRAQGGYARTSCPSGYRQIGSFQNRLRECQSEQRSGTTSSHTWVDSMPPFIHYTEGASIYRYRRALEDRNLLVLDERIMESGKEVSGPHRLAVEACHSRSTDDGESQDLVCYKLHLNDLASLEADEISTGRILAANGEFASFPASSQEYVQHTLPVSCRQEHASRESDEASANGREVLAVYSSGATDSRGDSAEVGI